MVSLSKYRHAHDGADFVLSHQEGMAKNLAKQLQLSMSDEFLALSRQNNVADENSARESLDLIFSTLLRETNLLKVKLFTPEGLVIYTTDPVQNVLESSETASFQSARGGDVATTLKVHEATDFGLAANHGQVFAISAYVPMGGSPTDELYQHVLKVCTDATRMVSWVEYVGQSAINESAAFLLVLLIMAMAVILFLSRSHRNQRLLQSEYQARLIDQSRSDYLTGLRNRAAFDADFSALFERSNDTSCISLLLIDLDDFKRVNDMYGHAIGDQVLASVARIIALEMPAWAKAYRLGGDEFCIVSDNSEEAARDLAASLLAALNEPQDLGEVQLVQQATIGIASAKRATDNVETILLQADLALYHAKQKSKRHYSVYLEGMSSGRLISADAHKELFEALEAKEFVVYLQPRIRVSDRSMVGAEALIRWDHPVRGLLMPDEFIPHFEKTGLVNQLSAYVLEQVCEFIVSHGGELLAGLEISINISQAELADPRLANRMKGIVQSHGLYPRQFELEVTESVLFSDRAAFRATARSLRDVGFKLSIDDFGVGYSNLRQLCDIGPDVIKLDMQLIAEMGSDSKLSDVIGYICNLAYRLNAHVVAEGVETGEQLAHAKALGCTHAQGFFFSRAMPMVEFIEYAKGMAKSDD